MEPTRHWPINCFFIKDLYKEPKETGFQDHFKITRNQENNFRSLVFKELSSVNDK